MSLVGTNIIVSFWPNIFLMYRYVSIAAWPKKQITVGCKLPSFYSFRNDVTIGKCYYWEQRKKSRLSLEEYQPNLLALLTAAKSLFSCGWIEEMNLSIWAQNTCLYLFCQTGDQNVFGGLLKYLQATTVLRVKLIWLFHLKHSLLHD